MHPHRNQHNIHDVSGFNHTGGWDESLNPLPFKDTRYRGYIQQPPPPHQYQPSQRYQQYPPPPQPPPPPPPVGLPAPVHISLTVNPSQLDQVLQNARPPNHQYDAPQVDNLYNSRFSHDYPYDVRDRQRQSISSLYRTQREADFPYEEGVPLTRNQRPPLLSRHPSHGPPPYECSVRRDVGDSDPPPPYSQTSQRQPHSFQSPHFAKDLLQEDYPSDLQRRRGHENVKGASLHRTSRGSCSVGTSHKESLPSKKASDNLPLGSEASNFCQGQQGKKTAIQNYSEYEEDNCSIQSMPTWGKGELDKKQGKVRGRGGVKRGQRSAGRGQFVDRSDCVEKQTKDSFRCEKVQDEDDDNVSIHSMPVRGRGQRANHATRGERGRGRGGRGAVRGQGKKQNCKSFKSNTKDFSDFDDDNDEDDDNHDSDEFDLKDHVTLHFKSSTSGVKGHQNMRRGGRDAGKRGSTPKNRGSKTIRVNTPQKSVSPSKQERTGKKWSKKETTSVADSSDETDKDDDNCRSVHSSSEEKTHNKSKNKHYSKEDSVRGKGSSTFSGDKYVPQEKEACIQKSKGQIETCTVGDKSKQFQLGKKNENMKEGGSASGIIKTMFPDNQPGMVGAASCNQKSHKGLVNLHAKGNQQDKNSKETYKSSNFCVKDVSKKDSRTTKDLKKAETTAQRLIVSMNFEKLFESADALKLCIKAALKFPAGGKFELEFKSESLLFKKNMSCCSFVITTSRLWDAKKAVRCMRLHLNQKLKTKITFTMIVNKREKKNEGVDRDENQQDSKHSETKEGKEINSGKPATASMEAVKEQPLPCPVNFNLSVVKTFSSSAGFKSFVEKLITENSTIEEFSINKDSILLDTKSSHCAIYLSSKADAKRLQKIIMKFKKETSLDILFNVTKWEEKSNDEIRINNWNCQIDQCQKEMEAEKNRILASHEEKITSLRGQLEFLSADSGDVGELSAAEDKLVEATKQQKEFLSYFIAISNKVDELRQSVKQLGKLSELQRSFGVECQRLKNALPIYARRQDITDRVKSDQVSIILGETGSGKSTQMAAYLHEAGLATNGLIVCTQPRKVAAVQLAERVAQELVVNVGDLVGVKVGNKRKIKATTKIVYMTDHSLLNECLEDKNFEKYSCIIVDEAHERSIYTDILLGMIKACLPSRPDLKVVITSATIDPQVFIEYFNCHKELRVSGRTFPVDITYVDTLDDFENYETKAVEKAAEIHREKPEGDILVFLSSPIEIQRCCEEFCRKFEGRTDFKCFPLHGQLLPEEQKKVFVKLDQGVRKVVFSTNCAETSITIDGIKYVIDTGVAKEMRYDPKKNMNLLGVHIISQSSADQRKGRAGRTASGECFRLYSEEGFNNMEAINQPEILRVHLGQAILKMAELGVNFQDYDFVKAPSESALTAALNTLEYLGAIEDEQISERGRWISKLPFDPSLGYLVYEGNKRGLLYDAIVLASVISNGSGFFYRGLTETEAQIAAKTKSQFGLESGDIFTWYTVYKIWKTLPRNDKHAWCRTNCINYKSLNYARQMVEEVVNTLSKEMKVPLSEEFSGDEAALQSLHKLVFRANARSICHFMGHSRAGYFYIDTGRQVHMHPSSVLAAMNVQPEWLVFTELVKTSREFIKGVLSVKEDWIREAVLKGYLDIDVNKAKVQTLSVVHLEELGSASFRSIVGPRFSSLQCLEELCEKTGMKHTILEADRDLGTIAIYSSSPVSQEVVAQLNDTKCKTIRTLQGEEKECKIFSKDSSENPNIRAVLGSGGCVRQVMMPHQTNQVLIRRVSSNNTEEDITSKFGEFGNILEVISFKATEPWGFIRYQSIAEAAAAVDKTERDETMAGSLRLDTKSKNTGNLFEARVSWLRRPVKGQGTAFIKCSSLKKPQLLGCIVYTENGSREICLSKKEREKKDSEDDSGQDLIIFKIGNTSEEAIKGEIQRLLGTDTEKENIKITIPRERVNAPSKAELEETKMELKSKVDPVNKENVSVWLSMPRETSCYQFGFLRFKDPVRGFYVCKRLNNCIHMNGQGVKISPSLKTVILIPKKIKTACQKQMNELFVRMKQDLGVEFEWKKLKENDAIEIKSDNPEGIVKARECINEEIQGQVIDCEQVESCRCLMTRAGQDYLKKVQKPTGCVIISDLRTRKVHLYGTAAECSQTMIEINKYLTENEANTQELFRLKGYGKPPGMMRELMSQFGPLLGELSNTYNLSNIFIDWKSHTLNCSGSEASMEDLRKFMSSLEESLHAKHSTRDTGLPECVVCMVPVETKEGLHRMEACGHAYCLPCLQHQAVVCAQNNQLPLVCAEEDCQQKLVWKDIHYTLSKKWISKQKLVSVALNTCVSSQPEKYKFCPTPNCPVVYEVTFDENGCEFNCAACFASTCSSCHIPFHNGMSCKMVMSATSAERDLDRWSKEDPNKRKICPKCKSPIEKIEGCNNMCCDACRTVFCWICCQVFSDSDKCYAHLAKVHGGFFD